MKIFVRMEHMNAVLEEMPNASVNPLGAYWVQMNVDRAPSVPWYEAIPNGMPTVPRIET